MQIQGDRIVCNIFHHVACFGCGKGIATSYAGVKEVRAMARAAGAIKLRVLGAPKQWHCKSCAAQHHMHLTGGESAPLEAVSPPSLFPHLEHYPKPSTSK